MAQDVTGPTAPRSIGNLVRVHAHPFEAQQGEGSSRAVRGAFRGFRGKQLAACGLQLCMRGLSSRCRHGPVHTWSCMGGHGPGPSDRGQRALGKSPAISPRLALSIRSQASVVSRPVTSWSHAAAQNSPLPLPQPCLPNLWEINPLLVARKNPGKLASAASHPSHPAVRPFMQLPTHPSPNSFAAPASL